MKSQREEGSKSPESSTIKKYQEQSLVLQAVADIKTSKFGLAMEAERDLRTQYEGAM